VIDALAAWARERSAPSLVITFDRHPAEVLRGVPVPLVCPVSERVRLISERGAQAVFVLPFTIEFSRTTAEEFVRDSIRGKLGASAVLLGHDSHFGRDRQGDLATLERLAVGLGLEGRSCEPERRHGRPLSSSMIREAVQAGSLDEAEAILGRPFALYGRVVAGEAGARRSESRRPTSNWTTSCGRPRAFTPLRSRSTGASTPGGRTWGGAPRFIPRARARPPRSTSSTTRDRR
jgi:riboflavin kinase/FMN adenylyltransferase